jgi:hypothetical protein
LLEIESVWSFLVLVQMRKKSRSQSSDWRAHTTNISLQKRAVEESSSHLNLKSDISFATD